MSWSLRFAEPIVLEDGVKLTTLREAIAHLGKVIPKSDHDMPAVLTAAEMLTNAAENGGPVEFAHRDAAGAEPSRRPSLQFRSQRHALGAAQTEARHSMKLTHRFAQLTPEKRPQDPNMDGTEQQIGDAHGSRAAATAHKRPGDSADCPKR